MKKIVIKLILKSIKKYGDYETYCLNNNKEIKLSEYLHVYFVDLLYNIYNNHPVIEYILTLLCEIEINIKLIRNKTMKKTVELLPYEFLEKIPKNTLYCNGCPYIDRSKIAEFLFGHQLCGYCHYLKQGDFTFVRHTDILWDFCKECGINEEFEKENE